MYTWLCKPDGAIEMHLDRDFPGGIGNAWYFLEDTVAGSYHYVTMVKTDKEEIFVWHKNMRQAIHG